MSSETELNLVARCRQGDAMAWNELFDSNYAATARFIFQLSPEFSREDAEEICQETFLAVIKNINSFAAASRLQTWVFRIATNKASDYRERVRAAKRGGGQVPVSLQAENAETGRQLDLPSVEPGPDAAAIASDEYGKLMAALDELEPPCREIIQLRYFGDLSYEELAVELELNPKTVSSRLSKCLDRLGEIAGKNNPFTV